MVKRERRPGGHYEGKREGTAVALGGDEERFGVAYRREERLRLEGRIGFEGAFQRSKRQEGAERAKRGVHVTKGLREEQGPNAPSVY